MVNGDVQFGGSVEAVAAATSYTDADGSYMDYDGASYAQFGAKKSGGGSLGTKIRTILAGVVKDAITIASSGLLITLLAGSTLAAQAITGTTLTLSGPASLAAVTATSIHITADNLWLDLATAGVKFKGNAAYGLIYADSTDALNFCANGTTTSLKIASGGAVTIASGLTVTAGGITVSAGGANVTGGVTVASGVLQLGQMALQRCATTSVGTTATGIYTDPTYSANFVFVFGTDGTAGFYDLVTWTNGAGPAVLSSSIAFGSPPTRTYTNGGGGTNTLKLALSAGTMNVRAMAMGIS